MISDVLWIGLKAPTVFLKQQIDERVRARWVGGAVDEVKALKIKSSKLPPILGLKQIQDFLNGKVQAENAIEEWTNKEFDYAKRQITWFKKQPEIRWFDIADASYVDGVGRVVRKWYTNIR